jgi:hypothetical protein
VIENKEDYTPERLNGLRDFAAFFADDVATSLAAF